MTGASRTVNSRTSGIRHPQDVAQYRARKAGKTADVLQALTEEVLQGTEAVRDWLASGHTLQELSARAGIPYATCHRIVNERLGTPNVEIGYLEKMISAISRGRRSVASKIQSHPRFKRVLLGFAKGLAEQDLVSSWETTGSEVSIVHAGLEIAEKVKELHPNLILFDVSMPNLEKSGLDRLKEFAKEQKSTIILTGAMTLANSALVAGLVREKDEDRRTCKRRRGGRRIALSNEVAESLLDRAKFFREHVQTILNLATGSFGAFRNFPSRHRNKGATCRVFEEILGSLGSHHPAVIDLQLRVVDLRDCCRKTVRQGPKCR